MVNLAIERNVIMFDKTMTVRNRHRALRVFAKTAKRKSAIPAIINLLKDETAKMRVYAAYQLGDIGAKEAGPFLVIALKDADGDVRTRAAAALRRIQRLFGHKEIKSEATALIAAFLREKHLSARESMITALSTYRDKRILNIMKSVAKDKSKSIRNSVMCFIGYIKAEGCDDILAETLLKDTDWYVRTEASNTIRILGHKNTAHILVKALADKDARVRGHVVCDIRDLDDKTVLPQIVKLVENTKDFEVKRDAVVALGMLGDKSHVPVIVKALALNDPKLSAKAEKAAQVFMTNKGWNKSRSAWLQWWKQFRQIKKQTGTSKK